MIHRLSATLVAVTATAGCITLESAAINQAGNVPTDPRACASVLVGSSRSPDHELDSGDIRLVNWNIQKGSDPAWTTDLAALPGDADLLVLQEAPLQSDAWTRTTADQNLAFAPGYRTGKALTGVMTVSNTKPLTQCNFASVEPWLRSPKATVITEYGLSDTDQTLLVVNMHALNFTIGTADYQQQFEQAQSVLKEHTGPILLSGDLNTWNADRSRVLNDITDDLGLARLDYDEDHRKRFFGQPLDHIYVRGLEVLEATTLFVQSSDHNPMSVRLSL